MGARAKTVWFAGLCLVVAGCSDGGSGGTRCDPPRLACGGACVDPDVDPAHCGGCELACDAGQPCVDGACASDCPSGTERCGDRCVDTADDPANCGGCGTACDPGAFCVDGGCVEECPAPRVVCDQGGVEVCVDTETSADHCGGCGNACTGGTACDGGTCVCPEGQEDCSGTCIDLQTDPNHCGGCGNVCTGGMRCEAGGCGCEAGWLDCDGTCVDPRYDAGHCGACGLACADGLACRNAACVPARCENGLGLPAPSRVDAGAAYGGIAVGDLDGDGDADVVTVDQEGDHALRVFESVEGSLALPVTIAHPPLPLTDLLIADLDGEGPRDLAGVYNQYAPEVHLVLRGATGAPRLQVVSWPYREPFIPKNPRAADLDADGDLDLVLSDGNYRTIHVARNVGGGAFEVIEDPVPLPPEARPDGLATGDMDGNGYDDLVIAEGHELYTVKTVGPFQFVPGEVYANGSQHGELALGDLDGDGDLDAVLDEGHLARNDGTGRFSDYGVLAERQTLVWRMAVGDVDGDGDADFVGSRIATFDVLRNEGDRFVGYSRGLGYGVTLPFLGDVTGDGTLDFVVGNPGTRWIDVLPNPGDGRYPAPQRIAHVSGAAPAIALGEIDAAPGPELLVVPGDRDRMYLVHATPDGPIDELAATPVAFSGVALFESDGDPQAEIATVRPGSGNLAILEGWPPAVVRDVAVGAGLKGVVAVDVDGDGARDLVTFEEGAAPGLRVLLADAFAPSPLFALGGGATPTEVLPADYDGDGDLDLLVGSDQALHLIENDGGTLVEAGQLGIVPRAIAAGDLVGDGLVSVVVADRDEDRVVVFVPTASGYQPGDAIGVAAARLAIADLEGGANDLVVLADLSRELLVYRSHGPGSLLPALGWPAFAYGEAGLIVEDLDGDRRPDVFAVGTESAMYYPARCLP